MKNWTVVALVPNTYYLTAESAGDAIRQLKREHGPDTVIRSVDCSSPPSGPPTGGTAPAQLRLAA